MLWFKQTFYLCSRPVSLAGWLVNEHEAGVQWAFSFWSRFNSEYLREKMFYYFSFWWLVITKIGGRGLGHLSPAEIARLYRTYLHISFSVFDSLLSKNTYLWFACRNLTPVLILVLPTVEEHYICFCFTDWGYMLYLSNLCTLFTVSEHFSELHVNGVFVCCSRTVLASHFSAAIL